MMADSIEKKIGESSGMTTQTRISEIIFGRIFGRIIDQKFDRNNYL